MSSGPSWIQKLKSASLLVIILQQKGYRCYNPSTRKFTVSRDVVFDEMSSWYKPVNAIDDVDAQNGNAAQNSQQHSQNISGPVVSSSSGSHFSPWTGRLR